jgi:4a-hydroxytetrahydrobiopterin dehydratase
MERKLLSQDEITQRSSKLDGWNIDGKMLKRRFEFGNFAEALAFVNQVGEHAEKLDHHPDISFGWGYAEVATTTHDRGGITDFDVSLASGINEIGADRTT